MNAKDEDTQWPCKARQAHRERKIKARSRVRVSQGRNQVFKAQAQLAWNDVGLEFRYEAD
jgi:hypothetical protein